MENEKTEQHHHFETIKEAIETNKLILKMADLYRVCVTMVKAAAKNICPDFFSLVETFLIAERMPH